MKRNVILFSLLCVCAILTFFLHIKSFNAKNKAFELNFPYEIGSYKGTDIALDDKVYEILETTNVIMRQYAKKGNPPIVFYFVLSPNRAKASDPPEVCLIGEGQKIIGKSIVELKIDYAGLKNNLKVNRLLAEKAGRKELILYWYFVKDEFTHNYYKQQMLILFNNLLFKSPGCGMVRIYTEILNDDEKQAINDISEFTELAMPSLQELLQ